MTHDRNCDHAHGNQVFPRGVEILGHEYTREQLSGTPLEEATYRSFAGAVPGVIADLKARVAAESNTERRAGLIARLRVQEDYLEAMKEVVPTPPNITMTSNMTLYQGGHKAGPSDEPNDRSLRHGVLPSRNRVN